MPFDRIKKRLLQLPDKETIDALSEPSIMDDVIKEQDPDQYSDIVRARNLKTALDSGLGGIGGTMGTVQELTTPEAIQLEKWLKLRQETDPNFSKLDEIVKTQPIIDPSHKSLSQEEIDKLRRYVNTPFDKEAFHEMLRSKLK
jgi:hypothetical protein